MRTWLRKHYGHLYYAIGTAHTAVGVIQYRDEWRALFSNGFFNQIDERGAVYQGQGYWFIILGPLLIAVGVVAQSHLNATGALPRAFNWIVVGTSLLAGLAMPLNGIWSVGLVGLLGLLLAKPAREEVNAGAGSNAPAKPVFEV